MKLYLSCLLVMTMLGAIASLFLKRASAADGILSMLKGRSLYVGGMLYFVSALLNIWILKKLDYSVVLPLTSLTYVWTTLLSYGMLKEVVTKKKLSGLGLIVLGAILVSLK